MTTSRGTRPAADERRQARRLLLLATALVALGVAFSLVKLVLA